MFRQQRRFTLNFSLRPASFRGLNGIVPPHALRLSFDTFFDINSEASLSGAMAPSDARPAGLRFGLTSEQTVEIREPVMDDPSGDAQDQFPIFADAEFTELEGLYRQALDALETADEGLETTLESSERQTTDEATEELLDPSQSLMAETESDDLSDFSLIETNDGQQEPSSRVSPRQIIEAALFVGGVPLTTKRLSSILGGEFDQDFIDATIDQLNAQYVAENRAYEIRFGEGGYRFVLKGEFERVRRRVFGFGPREIKLSQEALEILALVAYRQPVSKKQVEDTGRRNARGLLRQLVRRELVALERDNSGDNEVTYRTTPRFLELFGLAHLDELPQADELNFR